jgi:TRAP-type C4-dicarboxylate transport system permease small subunit
MNAPMLARLDRLWTRLEVALASLVAAALALLLVAWVVLKGLASQTSGDYVAGAVLRAGLLALAGALLARRGFAKRRWVDAATGLAALLGAGLGLLLKNVGVSWAANVLGWLQDGSTLTLAGGLPGLATRLTLWLVLLGASLATAQGRHLTIDLVARALSPRLRAASNLLSGLVAALVCLVSAWGFFDFIAIDGFHAALDAPPAEKWSAVQHGLSRDAFFTTRQLVLDATMAPRVLGGARWDTSLSADEWNAWLDAADWSGVLDPTTLREAPGATHVPLVVTGQDAARALLMKPLSLVVPFGLLVLALRFLLWVLRGAPVEGAHGATS